MAISKLTKLDLADLELPVSLLKKIDKAVETEHYKNKSELLHQVLLNFVRTKEVNNVQKPF